MTDSEARIAKLEAELEDLKSRESVRASEEEAKQAKRSDLIHSLLSLYGCVALFFTVYFQYRLAIESGFIVWFFFGSWFACILGAVWPLSMWMLF